MSMDQELADAAAGQTLRVHSPGGITFLRELNDVMAAILKL